MTPPPLVDSTGRPVPLGRHLGSGGEGAVFALPNDPSRVAKVYHDPLPAERAEKLKVMIALADPRLLSVATWPTGLLTDARSRRPVGFVMPRLVDYQEIWHLYNPIPRLKSFPRAGWTFQVRAATNLAAAFDEVHKAGCVIGDVQLRNAHVSPQALVRLVDCDSFQIRANGKQFLCDVGLPHYIPPELQGKPLRGLVRTENHDRFGLAVLVFQLLFVGRHPYAGVYLGVGDPSFDRLIAEYRFAHGPAARSWGMEPPPHTPTLTDIPPDLGDLFRRAFERGSEAGTRPRPAEWVSVLQALERAVVECPADPGHFYWRGAGQCVWCRLQANNGPEYYFGVAGGAGTFAIDEAKLQDVLRQLAAIRELNFRYDRDRFLSRNPPAAEPVPAGLNDHRATMSVIGAFAGLCATLIPLGCVQGAVGAVGVLGVLVFGTWLAILQLMSPWQRERSRRRKVRDRARDTLEAIEDVWDRLADDYRHDYSGLNRSIHAWVADCRALAAQHQSELRRVAADAETRARTRYLRLHSLADAEIPKVGAGRKQALAAHHIFTAADVEWNAVRRIKGFGDALTGSVVAWRDEVLSGFRFDPTTGIPIADQQALAVQFRTRQRQLLAELDRKLRDLESLAPVCRASLEELTPNLKTAIAEWERTEADLRVMARV